MHRAAGLFVTADIQTAVLMIAQQSLVSSEPSL